MLNFNNLCSEHAAVAFAYKTSSGERSRILLNVSALTKSSAQWECIFINHCCRSRIRLRPSREIYPNPAYNVLTIENIESEKTLIIISDALGNEIYRKMSESNSMLIDMNDFKPGVYFIHTDTANKKFIKL